MINEEYITQLYNIFASLCEYIVKGHSKNYLVRYGCIASAEKRRVKNEIENATPLKRGENGRFIRLKAIDIDEGFISQIQTFSENLRASEDNNCIMGLIQALDGSLAELLKFEITRLSQNQFSHELNTNRGTTGIGLLPRCDCVWARKSRMSYSYRRIDNYLKHFMVMEDRVLYEIEDKHIFLPKHFFKSFDKNNRLNVAVCPITAETHFTVENKENSDFRVFTVTYDESKMDEDNLLVWNKIVEAGHQGSEIIVFPETLGNEKMQGYIQNKLQELDESKRDCIPAMIILPSYYHDQQNSCTIIDKYGNEIATQYKENPFVKETQDGELMEDIIGCNIVNIFHYEGIGRFAILICKDFLTTRYMERIMRGFMTTMLIVPSFSTGAYDFKTSFDLCAHDYCNVVWINSCAAMTPDKIMNFEHIGYVRKRITRYDDESKALYKMKPCKGLLEGKCDQSCIYYDSFGMV